MFKSVSRWVTLAMLGWMFTIPVAHAQYGRSTAMRDQGYATDYFDGFDALDKETRIPQKGKSFWLSVKFKEPGAQLEYAKAEESKGNMRRARRACEALVREWPTTLQGAQAQQLIAEIREKNRQYDRAFDEYQYLLVHYAGHCPYNEILDRQLRIANLLLHDNRSFLGLQLSGTTAIRERFEQVVANAPRASNVPEIMLIIGSIHVSDKELVKAISLYDGLLNRFPNAPQAVDAAFLSAQCRYSLATKYIYNEDHCREAIAFFNSLRVRMATHPRQEQFKIWHRDLLDLREEQNYRQAVFYDSRTRKREAAIAAYRRFLADFPESKYAAQARARLAALSAGAPPAK